MRRKKGKTRSLKENASPAPSVSGPGRRENINFIKTEKRFKNFLKEF